MFNATAEINLIKQTEILEWITGFGTFPLHRLCHKNTRRF